MTHMSQYLSLMLNQQITTLHKRLAHVTAEIHSCASGLTTPEPVTPTKRKHSDVDEDDSNEGEVATKRLCVAGDEVIEKVIEVREYKGEGLRMKGMLKMVGSLAERERAKEMNAFLDNEWDAIEGELAALGPIDGPQPWAW